MQQSPSDLCSFASGGVDIDLLKVGVDVVDVHDGQSEGGGQSHQITFNTCLSSKLLMPNF